MEYPRYLALYYYLANKRYPLGATETDKRRLRDQARKYCSVNGRLYRKGEGNQVYPGREVLHQGNAEEVINKVI
ncbi:hypothetical protein O0I10_013110 [Lichtheimia ornata]|uniref:Uncharacterized protein n=1 Tax=Lichtheimia ornata TaxID=688661 RepID=A0AAD7UQQ3_9FUNG|nr:uncharacterized protein O0I10_013110 [Lichtheimia ornata]KAJ8651370.1 hypothetical protein O0I10_013110 [Lichtheimia ornata]